ncbi:MAG: sulfotransferase domain-containing protein, partial [Planctomycetia bacterium]|nr:sulfotransferase domain-containing protein [Planctomycetia bacterium]
MKSFGKKLRRFFRAIGHRSRSADACPMGFVRMGDFSPNDIFIAGYPKSGNSWMQVLVSCITYGIDPDTSPDSLVQELV